MQPRRQWILFLLAAVFASDVSCKIPSYIKLCPRKNNSECLMQNYQTVITSLRENGEPAFKVPNTVRFPVARIEMQATPELQVSISDAIFTGVDKSVIKEMEFTDTELRMLIHCDAYNFDAKYKMKGRILILPIEGEGTMFMSQQNFDIDYRAKLKIEERKGKKYYYVDNNSEDTVVVVRNHKKVVYRFDNLFGGDPRLGPEMNSFLNENWADVFNEVRVSMQHAAAFYIINPVVNGFLRHIPIDELFLSE